MVSLFPILSSVPYSRVTGDKEGDPQTAPAEMAERRRYSERPSFRRGYLDRHLRPYRRRRNGRALAREGKTPRGAKPPAPVATPARGCSVVIPTLQRTTAAPPRPHPRPDMFQAGNTLLRAGSHALMYTPGIHRRRSRVVGRRREGRPRRGVERDAARLTEKGGFLRARPEAPAVATRGDERVGFRLMGAFLVGVLMRMVFSPGLMPRPRLRIGPLSLTGMTIAVQGTGTVLPLAMPTRSAVTTAVIATAMTVAVPVPAETTAPVLTTTGGVTT